MHRAEYALYYLSIALACVGSLALAVIVIASRNGILVWHWY